jgi:transposase
MWRKFNAQSCERHRQKAQVKGGIMGEKESSGSAEEFGEEGQYLADYKLGLENVVGEMGINVALFVLAKRLSAWMAVAPGNDERIGRRRTGKTRQGHRALQTGLIQLAHAAARTKWTYLSALYHRLAASGGKKRAIVAVAHSMVVSAFHMLSRNEPDQDLGAHYFEAQRQHHLVDRLTRRIERLGYRVSLEPAPAV